MEVSFVRAEDSARGVKTFWFQPERPARYIAGQFTEIFLPHSADERGQRRWFTLSSSPSEELLAITTKFADDGSTFKKQLGGIEPGTELNLAEPMGDFVLPKDPTIPLLFVAAGMGITPVRSMIKWLLDTKQKRDIRLIYTAKPEEAAFMKLLKDYGLKVETIKPTANQILERADQHRRIYLSGPEKMVETYYKKLKHAGVAENRLVADYFPGYKS